ncbi:retropepsin-like aspartic protease [Allohahella marinimesophila]|uniref:TIGR02281 family clan AA aspartic protease n=1 Tax=Allohahella marinimesophila TaxID=1054972 RepID=A0ABP7P3U8_9GAMM
MPNDEGAMGNTTAGRQGKLMLVIAWIIGIGLLASVFDVWESKQLNPNQSVSVMHEPGQPAQLVLQMNRWGHYVVNGSIEDRPAEFLLDTGATRVTVPESVAERAGLSRMGRSLARTANGTVTVYDTVIDRLEFGGMVLRNVKATINPAMSDDDAVLLGMSALRQFDLRQSLDTLTLSKPLPPE